jgi:hypothetical protein
MVEGVDPGSFSVEVRRRDPFGVTVAVCAGGPASFGEFVVWTASQDEVVDVGLGSLSPWRDVVDLAQVAGHVAAGERAATVFGVEHKPLSR